VRDVPEWVGASDSTAVPSRVRLRVFDRDKGRCQCGCNQLIRPGDSWETDHEIAIANGGANRETNLRTLLAKHHKIKTAADIAEKSKTYERRLKHVGIKKKKFSSFQTNRDGKYKKKMDGTLVLRGNHNG
jgi:5-methylcytosine-specific restriction protein A